MRAVTVTEELFRRSAVPAWLRPVLGGLAVGGLALLAPSCRFEPSCSRYAEACLQAHGAGRGSLLSLIRLCKCHPFHPGGIDLPPPAVVPTK